MSMLAVTLAVALATIGGHVAELFEDTELITVDARFSARDPSTDPSRFLVVAVDDATLAVIDEAWPFSAETHAAALARLASAQVIGYGIRASLPGSSAGVEALIR